MYLAAKDEDAPATHGFSIQTRIEHFFTELALIGRSHNWDSTRINPRTEQEEYYDDLDADKPSCYGGVKKRLLQSVQGHPLLQIVNESDINLEIINIVRAHFIHCITDKNCAALQAAWQDTCAARVNNSPILNELNFSPTQQQQHIALISEKYGSQLDETLSAYLQQKLTIKQPFSNLAEQFSKEFTAILDQKYTYLMENASLAQASSLNCLGMFTPDDTEAEQKRSSKKQKK